MNNDLFSSTYTFNLYMENCFFVIALSKSIFYNIKLLEKLCYIYKFIEAIVNK